MLIVDVFNVVHAAASARHPLHPLSPHRLFDLVALGRYRSAPAWLVCDGTAGGLARSTDRPSGLADAPGPRFLFAGPGQDADSLIEALLDRLHAAGRAHVALVVSSDRRVQQAAVGVRARWAASPAFLELLTQDARRAAAHERLRTGDRPDFAARDALDRDSVAHWLRAFGVAPDAPPPAQKPGQPARPASPSGEPELDPQLLADIEDWARSLDSVDPPPGRGGTPPPRRPDRE